MKRTKKIKTKLKLPKVWKHNPKEEIKKDASRFPLDHISASSMISFSTNPLLFKIKYINKDIFETTTSISSVIGKSFHKAMEVYYGGSDLAIQTESEAIEMGLKVGMDFLEQYNDGFIEYSTTIETKQKALELLAFCFNSYIKECKYNFNNVIATEEKIIEQINVEWKGQSLILPVKLKGFIDRIDREDGKLKIIDYKTCSRFSDPDKIDAAKILAAVEYYLLTYAKYGEEPYSMVYEEVKYTKNKDGSPQVKKYEVVFEYNELYFDFYFRFYQDMIRALNGEMVFVPNVHAMFDNEVAIVSYIHRLDIEAETAKLMRKHKVESLTDLLKKEIQSAGNMRSLLKSVEEKFVSAKNIDYEKMPIEQKIQTKLLEYGIMLQFDSVVEGSSVDLYRYNPTIGVKMSRIKSFVDDVEQVTGIAGIRVLAPIRGTKYVGFEIPKEKRVFPSLPTSEGFELSIGEKIDGTIRRFDLREAPHILVSGSSGSGKSTFLHSLIVQLMGLNNVELHLFDPKMVEFDQYNGRVTEYQDDHIGIAASLIDLVKEMDRRYTEMKAKGVKNIADINGNYKFVIIDEYADLKDIREVDESIKLLSAKGRACGIHLIVATQRASTKVIDGEIKVNFKTKIVFRMSKEIDSRVLIDESGAEKLLGKGDCLFSGDWGIERLQGYII